MALPTKLNWVVSESDIELIAGGLDPPPAPMTTTRVLALVTEVKPVLGAHGEEPLFEQSDSVWTSEVVELENLYLAPVPSLGREARTLQDGSDVMVWIDPSAVMEVGETEQPEREIVAGVPELMMLYCNWSVTGASKSITISFQELVLPLGLFFCVTLKVALVEPADQPEAYISASLIWKKIPPPHVVVVE